MIPCHVCGTDASTGWIQGLPPAPDSQKLALCPLHDTPENRDKVADAWRDLLSNDILTASGIVRSKLEPPVKLITVRFNGGGMLSFTGTRCSTTDHNTLCIEEPEGKMTFLPLQHIRDYSIAPVSGV